jgi:hypothetical protein
MAKSPFFFYCIIRGNKMQYFSKNRGKSKKQPQRLCAFIGDDFSHIALGG